MGIMVAVVALVGIAFVVAVIQIVRYEKELRRMAQFLDAQKTVGNARLTTEVHSKGVVALAKAANAQLDARHRDEQLMLAKDRELRDGFAYLSHDIRTPLMGARGYLQLALDEEEAATSRRYVQAVEGRLSALQTMLDQLFLFTRVSDDSYALECSEVVLPDVVSEVLVSFFPQFEEQGWTPKVTLDEADSPTIWADPAALKRILENLTLNMLRHGSDEPSIVQKNTAVTFSNRITDESLLDANLLFDRFYKGQGSTTTQGSGLGLAIVAQLAAAMGAQAEARILSEAVDKGEGALEEHAYLHITLTFKPIN